MKQTIEHDENNIDAKTEVVSESINYQTNENNDNRSSRKSELLLTSFKNGTVLDSKNSITHSEDHDKNNLNTKTEVLSDSINCHTNERNDDSCEKENKLLLTRSDESNELKFDRDNIILDEQGSVKQHINHDENSVDAKTEVISDSVNCQTDDNNDSKCNTKATLLLTCNDEINECNNYKDSTILDEEKSIKQRLTHESNVDAETEDVSKPINCHINENNNDNCEYYNFSHSYIILLNVAIKVCD